MNLLPADIERLTAIARKYGAIRVHLFGSHVRGEADAASDLDVLVDFEPGRSLFDLVRLERELGEALGVKVDVVTSRGLHPSIRARVEAEVVRVL